ncbi:stabilizer of axonemal microtubules 4-like [Styela clava]
MGKLKTGPPISIIKASRGAQSNLTNFYSTSYQTSHGDDNFIPKPVKSVGTGYKANFRPDIYYTTRLDQLDNLELGKDLKQNYETFYMKQHRAYTTGSDGKDKLPLKIISRKSGFTQQSPITYADSKNVTIAREGTMTGNVYKSLLRRLQEKRISHLDDGSLIPETETTTCYLGKPSERMKTHLKDVGFMEPSGFTHYHHFDPVLYLGRAPFDGARYGNRTLRPTGISEHQNHFVRWPTLEGTEMNAGVRKRAKRDTGYSFETAKPRFVHRKIEDAFTNIGQMPPPVASRVKKQDPCEYVNLTRGGDHTSLARSNFQGQQRPPKSPNHKLSRVSTGHKELTGFSTNNEGHVAKVDDKTRFISHYDVKFGPKQAGYPGFAKVSGFAKQTNGFTKSTVVHSFGDGVSFRPENLRTLHPIAAKVVKHDNPCYMDNTRNFKLKDCVRA